MNDDEFATWAATVGIPSRAVTMIEHVAKIPLEAKTVRTDFLFSPEDIQDLFERNGYNVNPQQAGFIVIGSCPNGDPIAIDVAEDFGSIWYLDHEHMHGNSLRACAIQIAEDLPAAYARICSDNPSQRTTTLP